MEAICSTCGEPHAIIGATVADVALASPNIISSEIHLRLAPCTNAISVTIVKEAP